MSRSHAKSSEVEIVCTIYPNDVPGLHNSYNFSVTNLSVVMEMRVFIRDFVPVCGAVQAMNDMHRMHMRVFSSHCASFGDWNFSSQIIYSSCARGCLQSIFTLFILCVICISFTFSSVIRILFLFFFYIGSGYFMLCESALANHDVYAVACVCYDFYLVFGKMSL